MYTLYSLPHFYDELSRDVMYCADSNSRGFQLISWSAPETLVPGLSSTSGFQLMRQEEGLWPSGREAGGKLETRNGRFPPLPPHLPLYTVILNPILCLNLLKDFWRCGVCCFIFVWGQQVSRQIIFQKNIKSTFEYFDMPPIPYPSNRYILYLAWRHPHTTLHGHKHWISKWFFK